LVAEFYSIVCCAWPFSYPWLCGTFFEKVFEVAYFIPIPAAVIGGFIILQVLLFDISAMNPFDPEYILLFCNSPYQLGYGCFIPCGEQFDA